MSANKSNELLQHASYNLNITQLKILNKIIDLIDSRKKEQYYEFNLKNFIINDLNMNLSNYTKIKKDLINMRKKTIKLFDKNDINKELEIYTGWFSSVIFVENTNTVIIEIPITMNKYYFNLQGYYTSIHAKITYGLKSKYSIRLYELLSSYKNERKKKGTDYIEVTIQYYKLRKLLDIDENKYKLYNHFKKRVLETAQKELKEKKTDIQFKIKINGRGKYKFIIFKIYNVKEEMERKEAKRKQELINNSDNIDKQIYTDIETTLEKMGFNEKERNKLISEHDEMKLRRNINYTLEADKNKKVKTHIKAFLRSALKADYAMNSYEQKQEYQKDKVKNAPSPLPIVNQEPQKEVSEINKQKEKLKTNNALYQEFIKFIAEIARNKPSGRASVILPNLISDSSSIDTTPFIDKFIDKFFKTIVKIK